MAFVTCGDPDEATTAAAVREAVRNGADLVELGIPFSDPTAEGPVIQQANIRALHGGITTDRVFALLSALRANVTVPFVLMAYANVVFSYGTDRFLARCKEVGVDGLLVPDLPFEEKEEFLPACREAGVALISTVTASTEERIATIAREAEGFLYLMVSRDRSAVPDEIRTDPAEIVSILRKHSSLPCVVGCGISTPEQAAQVLAATGADGIVARTAIIDRFTHYGAAAPAEVGAFVRAVKQVL
jgi:tryptophan synthase alpha chain